MHVMLADEDEPMMEKNSSQTSQTSHISLSSESSEDLRSVTPMVQDHHSHEVAVGSKRHRITLIQDEDGLVSLPKYPKLDATQQIYEPQEGQSASFSSSDGFPVESSETENQNPEGNDHPEDNNHPEENDHPASKLTDHNSTKLVQVHSEDPTAELDSDAESLAISPQREILNNDVTSTVGDKESSNTFDKYMAVSTILRVQNHIAQLESNNDLENNNVNSVLNLETNIKQSNSQAFSSYDENTDEPVNVISIPENSSTIEPQDEYLQPEESDQTEAQSNNAGISEKEADLQNVVPNGLYAVATQSLRQPNLKVESNSSQDQHSQLSQDFSQEQINDSQSIGNQVYALVPHIQVIESQMPSTSRGFEDNSYEMSRASSVSDLNLAQLVLSLKGDIQKLTEKVEKQEMILDTVVQANKVDLTPLFTQSFIEKYNLKVPFTNRQDFDNFNQNLEKNQIFYNEFVTSLTGYIDNEVTLAKNVLNMVKQYMAKELAILYNASKRAPNKEVLKDTTFAKCLLEAVKIAVKDNKLPLEKEKAFLKTLGRVISAARGWHNNNEQ